MTSPNPPVHARKRAGKLDSQIHRDFIAAMVHAGASAAQIRDALAQAGEGRPAVTVSRSAVHSKVIEMGLRLAARAPAVAMPPPNPEAIEVARRSLDAESIKERIRRGPKRKPSWLKSFEIEIRELLFSTDLTLYGIWDELAARYAQVCPQLAQPLSNQQKTFKLNGFIGREAAKTKRSPLTNWAKAYREHGRHHRAVAPAHLQSATASIRETSDETQADTGIREPSAARTNISTPPATSPSTAIASDRSLQPQGQKRASGLVNEAIHGASDLSAEDTRDISALVMARGTLPVRNEPR